MASRDAIKMQNRALKQKCLCHAPVGLKGYTLEERWFQQAYLWLADNCIMLKEMAVNSGVAFATKNIKCIIGYCSTILWII